MNEREKSGFLSDSQGLLPPSPGRAWLEFLSAIAVPTGFPVEIVNPEKKQGKSPQSIGVLPEAMCSLIAIPRRYALRVLAVFHVFARVVPQTTDQETVTVAVF